MSRPHKNVTFNELQAYWYAKLEKTGFKDIEVASTRRLKAEANEHKCRASTYPHKYADLTAYYDVAALFLNQFEFSCAAQEAIWTYHTEGLIPREICEVLNKAKVEVPKELGGTSRDRGQGRKWSRTRIRTILGELESKMIDRYVLPTDRRKQMI